MLNFILQDNYNFMINYYYTGQSVLSLQTKHVLLISGIA